MSNQILIKIPMRVLDADIVTGYMAGGIPSVTAVEGLTHLIQRRFNERLDPEFSVDGWSYIIEKITYHNGKYSYVGYEKDRKGKDKVLTPSMRDDKKAKIDCSIIIKADSSLTESNLNDMRTRGEMNYIFNRLRLAGGDVRVKGLGADKWRNKLDFKKLSVTNYIDFLKASGMNAMLIEDQTHLIDEVKSSRVHRLDRLVDLVSRQSQKTKERAYSKEAIEMHEMAIDLFSGVKNHFNGRDIEVVSTIGTTLNSDYIISLSGGSKEIENILVSLDPKFNSESEKITKKAKGVISELINKLEKAKRTFSIIGFYVNDENFINLYRNEYLEPVEREYHGYLFALNIGYCGIGELKKRRGTRINEMHTYAEPVLGVARARTIGSVIFALKEGESVNSFWVNNSLFSNEDISNNMYVVVGEEI
ncbi:type I-F CRISPR-associated protein Csy2 [Vibrio parahaemolyticus]|uniref:type I-F CRISPR-associated protein Csy2 n=1 Tax=Vibrio parahaemolyticus TaxID=670 RepID=UPI001E2C6C8B|nr:type I-F CRISPR-associated protein Csy2 [Vibrio parahaemolyticus]